MNGVLYPMAAVCAWLAALWLGWGAWRRREANAGALAASMVVLALVWTVTSPAVWVAVDRLAGWPNLAQLLTHVGALSWLGVVLGVLLRWSYPGRARRVVRAHALAGAAVVAGMGGLFAAAPDFAEDPVDFAARHAASPWVGAYLTLYAAAFAAVQVEVGVLCLRQACAGGGPWLRRGLRLTSAGTLLGLLYCATRVSDVAAAVSGVDPTRWESVARLASSVGVLLPLVGWTMPSWGPRLSAALCWRAHARAYRRLYPLWSTLAAATPGIVLDPSGARRRAARDVEWRLSRRVVEIHDALGEARARQDPSVRESAERAGRDMGLTGARLEAAVEAEVLAAALAAPAPAAASAQPGSIAEGAAGGRDLEADLAWLCALSKAVERRPLRAQMATSSHVEESLR